MGKVILVASGKGGVGKTIFTTNAGVVLAQRGFKVALLDLDMGLRNLDICLGLENKVVYDIADVLMGVCRIKQALIKDRRFENLYMMSAAQKINKGDITPLHMHVLCNKLRDKFDYIIIDTSGGIGKSLELAAAGADRAVIVTMPEHVAIRDADMVDHRLVDMGIKDRTYVVNKVKGELMTTGVLPTISQISESLRPKMSGIIQYDDNIHLASNNGTPIVMQKGSYIEQNFSNIVDRIIGN